MNAYRHGKRGPRRAIVRSSLYEGYGSAGWEELECGHRMPQKDLPPTSGKRHCEDCRDCRDFWTRHVNKRIQRERDERAASIRRWRAKR